MSIFFQQGHILTTMIWIIACLVAGSLVGLLSNSGNTRWYTSLNRPSFAPPSWVFGPTWAVLYIMIACAGSYLWMHRDQHSYLFTVFIIQLFLNYAWSFIFFRAHAIGIALIEILLLLFSIIVIMVMAYSQHQIVTWLFFPYALWVAFAAILNAAFWVKNS